jgi:hypothetical protein
MITYRGNRAGTVFAAYRGDVRVGYVTKGDLGWRWELNLLRPSGGHYLGTSSTYEQSTGMLETALREWMVYARLQEMT